MTGEDFDDEDLYGEEDEQRPTTLWRRTDSLSNGRWLFVEQPDREGYITVSVEGVYYKHLTPDEAEAMSHALLAGARQGRVVLVELEAARALQAEARARCEQLGGHEWGDWVAGKWTCRRSHCGAQPQTVAYSTFNREDLGTGAEVDV